MLRFPFKIKWFPFKRMDKTTIKFIYCFNIDALIKYWCLLYSNTLTKNN